MNTRIEELWKEAGGSNADLEKFVDSLHREYVNVLRQAWYDKNNMDTSQMDLRELAIHIGVKSGLIIALNRIGKLE